MKFCDVLVTWTRALEDCVFPAKKLLPVCVFGAAREIKTAGKKVAFEKHWEFLDAAESAKDTE